MMQNMSFIPTHCFITVPVRIIIIIIATIATSSLHAVTQNSIPVTSHISSELNSGWSTTRIQNMCTYINHNFCIHFWVCGKPTCFVFCENSIDLYRTNLFSSWMIMHRPTDRSRFNHCNNTRGRIASLRNFLSEYLTTLFNSKELEILEGVEVMRRSLLEIFFHHLLIGGLR